MLISPTTFLPSLHFLWGSPEAFTLAQIEKGVALLQSNDYSNLHNKRPTLIRGSITSLRGVHTVLLFFCSKLTVRAQGGSPGGKGGGRGDVARGC
eukprot:6697204-Prymnesium_polylepis.1